jgi:hypothetical protein
MIALVGLEKTATRQKQRQAGATGRTMQTGVNPVNNAPINQSSPNVTPKTVKTPAATPIQGAALPPKNPVPDVMHGPGKQLPIGVVHPDHVALRGVNPSNMPHTPMSRVGIGKTLAKFPGGKVGAGMAIGGAAMLGVSSMFRGNRGGSQTVINNG